MKIFLILAIVYSKLIITISPDNVPALDPKLLNTFMEYAGKYILEGGAQLLLQQDSGNIANQLISTILQQGPGILNNHELMTTVLQNAFLQFQQTSVSSIIDFLLDNGIMISTNVSAPCVKDIKYFLKALLTNENEGPFALWTLKLLDSLGKVPSGVIQGNINWLGDHEQCLDIEVREKNNLNGPPQFKSEYCLVFLMVETGAEPPPSIFPKIGLCFPSSCTTHDKTTILNYWLFLLPAKMGIQESYCYVKEGHPWDIYGTIAVVIIVGLILLNVLGTCYEGLLWWDDINHGIYQFRQKIGVLANDIILAFSCTRNIKKIVNIEDQGSSIPSIHGLKVVSMLWITGVHVVVMTFQDYPWRNQLAALKIAKKDSWIVQLFADAAIATDTFFCISGLLVAYVTLNTFKRLGAKFNVAQFYFFRYWRLTPPYFVILSILSGLVVHFGDGPMWALIQNDMTKCQSKWWRNILYIQNLYPDFYDQCLLPAWYLAVDTQMYLMAPLFLIPLIKKPKFGLILLLVSIVVTTITPGILTYVYDLETYTGIFSRKPNMDMFANMLYNKPWNRMATYLIGILVGYIMHSKGKNVRLKRSTVFLGWLMCFGSIVCILFGPVEYFRGKQMTPLLYAIYGGFSRPVWGGCVAWIVYACYIGYGGVLNSFLSWKVLIPLSRLSYSFYLSHMLVIHHFYYSRQYNLSVEYFGIFLALFGIIVMSCITAGFLTMLVESPFIELLNVIVKKQHGQTVRSANTTFNKNEAIKQDERKYEKNKNSKSKLSDVPSGYADSNSILIRRRQKDDNA